ncbi:hypothetical protein DSECCO2_141300 [anaerobic digester metagenome]
MSVKGLGIDDKGQLIGEKAIENQYTVDVFKKTIGKNPNFLLSEAIEQLYLKTHYFLLKISNCLITWQKLFVKKPTPALVFRKGD